MDGTANPVLILLAGLIALAAFIGVVRLAQRIDPKKLHYYVNLLMLAGFVIYTGYLAGAIIVGRLSLRALLSWGESSAVLLPWLILLFGAIGALGDIGKHRRNRSRA